MPCTQDLHPGSMQPAYWRELETMVAGEAIRRLWAKDLSLWPAEDRGSKSLTSNLSWLDLPEIIGPYMSRVAAFANSLEAAGLEDAVFLGMGDSNLAAESIANLNLPKRWKRIFVLDSTDPAAVRAVEGELNFERSLFIVASKSGKKIEGHVLLLYFLEQMRVRGIADPGQHFVAVTEENTYLANLAKEYKFRGVFFDPPGISGRFSALIHFGLLLSGLCRVTPKDLLITAASMNEFCRRTGPGETNPAQNLAAFLAAAVMTGNDRLLLFGTASLSALTYRVAQLVGVSTSKGGRGLIPICADVAPDLQAMQQGCTAAIFCLRGDEDSMVRELTSQLKSIRVPVISVELGSPEELGPELFKWEVATALACALLEVNPFDEPDIHQSTALAAEMLEKLATKRQLPSRTVRVREEGIELFAEGETRQQISTLNLSEALRTFFEARNPAGYVATLAFLDRRGALRSTLERIRAHLASRLGIPALLSFGPRYLHHLGQVFQGGPSKGLFVILTGEPLQDIAIPGAGYSFGQLQLALAMGDFDSLERHGRPVLRLHLAQGLEPGLARLENVVQHALRNIRRGM